MKKTITTMLLVGLLLTGCTTTGNEPSTESSPPNTATQNTSGQTAKTAASTSEAITTTPSEPVSSLVCQEADLENLRIRPNQDGPLTVAYGSKIVKSAAVNTGDGFTVVAALLAKPTGPEGADKVAWLMREGDGTGWVVEVSPYWDGSGGPTEHRIIPLGPDARAAAIACLN